MNSNVQNNYFDIDAVNWSSLKEMRRSPLHYQHRLHAPRKDTSSLVLGRAIHLAVLEPARFETEVAVFDGLVRRGKAWDEFQELNADRTILKPSEVEQCLSVRDAVRNSPVASPYLTGGVAEQTVTWTDPATGIACKARPDYLCADGKTFVDLKSARDIDERSFGSAAARYGYANQLAWYREGQYRSGLGERTPVLIAVEHEPPYDVGVFTVDEDLLYTALAECQELLRRVALCRSTGKWPGRYGAAVPLALPRWAYVEDDEDAADLGLKFGE